VSVELTTEHTVVNFSDHSAESVHQKLIPVEYYRHLIRIQNDSRSGLSHSRWLQTIMDCFIDELQGSSLDVSPSWRSAVLNPLLIRAFHGIQGDDEKTLVKAVTHLLEKKNLGVKDFGDFYTRFDVINEGYNSRWNSLEAPKPRGRNGPAQQIQGMVNASPSNCQQPLTLLPSFQVQEQRATEEARVSQQCRRIHPEPFQACRGNATLSTSTDCYSG